MSLVGVTPQEVEESVPAEVAGPRDCEVKQEGQPLGLGENGLQGPALGVAEIHPAERAEVDHAKLRIGPGLAVGGQVSGA